MKIEGYLCNHFLIAMPTLMDINFSRTVALICEHNENGAMGIVINRPLNIDLNKLLQQIKVKEQHEEVQGTAPICLGGPMGQNQGFVMHHPIGEWETTLKISDTLGLTTSYDIVDAIAQGKGPSQALIALGYAGWDSHQLEQELAENAWLSVPADNQIIFDISYEQRWEAAAALIGVNFSNLSGEIGHA
ncbi:YqgE/AlgH family protein [Candidatus Nitrosacidococcus tergens]|uniref:UPF0301 protein NSCAC_0270 n=1 Tax=Candidatus Nitrosacidococcus tergens TaxID=553981 RepID=A0A7G1Q8F2_9GAMM|nr:YqgE/AlgH family protein [Candidatus Nitrosacidococcus tergens]CAB1274640.1 hypothetical protein NSCAC_0270 [Candidatus Nitrosacidococcus tergens]